MTTINRTIETEHDKVMAARLIENRAVPFTLSLTDGLHRTTAQNRLQRKWMLEISEQRGDMTPEEVRAYCKLTIGVPILRAENEAFRVRYDEVVKPLPYESKMAIMMEPLDLPVTRLMTTKQNTDYLDGIIRHFASQGVVLTMPDDMRFQESGAIPSAPDAAEEAALPSPHESAGDPPPADSLSSTADAADSVGGPASVESAGDTEGKVLSPADIHNPEWLQTVARMLWAATYVTGIVENNLELLNNQRIACGAIDGIPSQSDKDKAGSIYKTCKSVVMAEIPASDAKKVIAHHAGLEPEAL